MAGKRSHSFGTFPVFLAVCCIVPVICIFFSCTAQNRLPGYLCYRLNANPTTLDPALIVDVTGGALSAKLFNGLVRMGDDLTVQPDIAQRWSVSQDGMLYTFKLKRGVLFSNKREVKADDIKYSFNRVVAPKTRSPNTWVFEKILGTEECIRASVNEIAGIKVIDDYTLQIRLKEPFSPFLKLLTTTAAYIVPREEVERWGPDFSSHPVGTGPFVLDEWRPNREILLRARRDYFGEPAKIKGIMYRIIPEDLTAATEFEVGNIDVLTIPVSEYTRYRRDPGKKDFISSVKGLNTYYLGMNCARPPFNNPHLREAVHYAVDTRKILDTIYEQRGRLAAGPLPDMLRAWDLRNPYTYDLRKAREIVQREWAEGGVIHFYITADQEIIDIAEVIQSYLHSAGLKVQITQLEWSAYKEAINRGEADMFYLSWWADYPDPENFLFPLFHSSNHGAAGNRTRYTNAAVDALITKGRSTLDEKKRNRLYQKAEELIVADAPWVPLWHKTDFVIRQPWVKNFKTYSIYNMDKGTDISF